jgi:hypothetical protein
MEGEALSLVCHDERGELKDIEKLIKRSLERIVIPGFEQSAHAAPRPVQPPRGPRKPQQGRPQTPKPAKNRVDRSNTARVVGTADANCLLTGHGLAACRGIKKRLCGNLSRYFILLVSFLRCFGGRDAPRKKSASATC